jgi:hypothetical protein
VRGLKLKTFIVVAMFVSFFIFAFGFFLTFNWAQSFLTENYPFEVARRHYQEHLPYMNENFGRMNLHVVLALIMLITGALQFSTKLRLRYPRVHRMIGYTYYGIGILNVSMAFYISGSTLGGVIAQISFYFTGFLWFLFSGISFKKILERKTKGHELWAYRSYIIAASTGFIRPLEFIVDILFPNNTMATLFGVTSWMSLILGLLLCLAISDVPQEAALRAEKKQP